LTDQIWSDIIIGTLCSIKSSSGKILYKPKDVAKRWSEYLGRLFNDNREEEESVPAAPLSGPPILKNEVRKSLHFMKNDKADGPDEVATYMLNR